MKLTRYKNRKLCCADKCEYVSLREVIEAIKAGAPVHVTAHGSGEDVTVHVLKSALIKLQVPVPALVEMIRGAA